MLELLFELNFDRPIPILLSLIPAILSFLVFIYALVKLPKSSTTIAFAGFVFATFVWQLSDTLIRSSHLLLIARVWEDLLYAGILFVGPCSIHFALLYTERKKVVDSFLLIFLLYFPALFFEVAERGDIFRHALVFDSFWGWINSPTGEFLNTLEISWISLCGFITLITLGDYAYKMRKVEVRNKQSLLIFVGYLIPATQGIVTQYILPVHFGIADMPLTTAFTVIFSCSSVYALAKYRFLAYNPMITSNNLIRTMNEGILVTDDTGLVKYVNDQFCGIIGYSAGELIDRKPEDVYTPESEIDKVHKAHVERSKGISSEYELSLQKKSGEIIYTWISSAPFSNQDNHQIGSLLIITDITAKKRAELAREIAFNITKAANRGFKNINSLGQLIYSEILRLIPKANFYISLFNIENNTIHFPFWIHENLDHSGSINREFSNGFTEHIIKSDESIFLKGNEVKRFIKENKLAHVKDTPVVYLATPLRHMGKVIGVLALQSDINPNQYDEHDFEFLKFLSGQVASVIDKQEMLEQQQQRETDLLFFRNLIDQSNDYILVVDLNSGKIIDVNERTCENLGYAKEDMMNMAYTDIHLVDGEHVWNDYLSKLRSGNSVLESCSYQAKNGTTIPIEVDMSVVTIDLAEYLVTVGRNIKERIELAETELKFSAILDTASDSIMISDEDCNILLWNQGSVEMFGYTAEEALQMSVLKLIPENLASKHKQGMRFDEENNEYVDVTHSTFESVGLNKHHKEFPIEISTAIWKTGGKEFYCEIIRNITERKKTQESLAIAHNELESFIYKASHDLKGPLSSSLGLINIARLESKEEKVNKHFDHIENSLKKLESILNDLRQVAIIKQGVIEFVELDVIESIKDIISTFKYYDEFDTIDFKFISNNDEPIITDRSLLELFLRNIIENAIKYQKLDYDKSYIHFDINKTKENIQITIKDNGIGIDANHVHTIFDMFVRANTTSKGTGLGLYIAKNAIDKLGGTIDVESEKEQGTTFKISLPLEEKSKEEEQ